METETLANGFHMHPKTDASLTKRLVRDQLTLLIPVGPHIITENLFAFCMGFHVMKMRVRSRETYGQKNEYNILNIEHM